MIDDKRGLTGASRGLHSSGGDKKSKLNLEANQLTLCKQTNIAVGAPGGHPGAIILTNFHKS